MSTNWDKRFLELAKHYSQWSKDPSTRVGAVIVDDKKRIVSVGFNGFPCGIDDTDERLFTRDKKLDIIIHAEMNAILFAKRDLSGCTLYTYPLPPCIRCAAHIIQTGISRVVSYNVDKDSKWFYSCNDAKALMEEATIIVDLKEQFDEA